MADTGPQNEPLFANASTGAAQPPGLTQQEQSSWPKFGKAQAGKKPIELLVPGSDLHKNVLGYLNKRLLMSERKMKNFYARWRLAERRVQAYIDLNDYEALLKSQNKESKAPKVVSITVPYCFATQATIVTYVVHTFLGRRPIFQVNSHKAESVQSAAKMEVVLQYNADATRLQRHLFQFFNDAEMYGVGILRTQWREEHQMRTIWANPAGTEGILGAVLSKALGKTKVRQQRLTFQGNAVASIDPYMFFPDPRVPMSEVNRRGEYVIWRTMEGKHTLLKEEAAGRLTWIKYIPPMPKASLQVDGTDGETSARSVLTGGDPQPGRQNSVDYIGATYYQVDQGTFDIIPAELGLGTSTSVERWIFAWANKGQIIQAEPFEADHNMHPVVVTEPYSLGYGFGQPSLHDYTGDLQDTMSWFVNSHTHNIRTALNNMFVVDPSRIEMQDLKNPAAGKLIRLKRAAYGQDVNGALQQLQVSDVTKAHIGDLQLFMRLGDALSSVNDNVRGLQSDGGRKTATEVRTAGEAAASRLAAHCRLISAQAIVDLTEQMSVNLQQYLSDEFYLEIVGEEGKTVPLRISPDQLAGDFQYPVNDGTLPLDKVALLDVWQQIMMGVAKDPELRQNFSLPAMFEWAAELAGAQNISRFKVQANVQPNPQVEAAAQAGNVVPMSALPGGGGAATTSGPRPSTRMMS